MIDPQDTPWWIRPDLGNDAGSMDWRTPTRHRHDLRVDADEFDRYNAARRVLQHRQYVLDSYRVICLMVQLAESSFG